MNWSIQINGQLFTNNTFADIDIPEIVDFLKQWNNRKETITVNTSGSTGTPKLIDLLKEDMIASAQLTGEHFNLQPNETALLCLPVKYIAGKMMIVRAIVLQLNLIYVPSSSNPIKELTKKINFAAMTPMQVKTIIKESPQKLDLITKLIIGGAPVDSNLEAQLQQIKTTCFSTYGMTETITHIAVKKLNGLSKSNSFEALPNVNLSTDNRGCLVINSPHLSSESFTTNDLALLLDNKHFKWTGRIDNVINSGGVKIQPEEVEKKIAPLISKNRFFITSQSDSLLGEKVILVIESQKEITNLKSQFKQLLLPFEIPKNIFYISQFIETETGKINRNATLKEITPLQS